MAKGKRTGLEAQIVEIIDNKLRETDGFISTEEIYDMIPDKRDGTDYKNAINKAKYKIQHYLKIAGLQLEQKDDAYDFRIKYFRYPENTPKGFLNEYWEKKRKLRLKALKELIQRSSGLLPESCLANFKIQVEENVNESSGKGDKIIEFDANNRLINLTLLPTLYYAIRDKQVVEFLYQPFGKKEQLYIFHPYYLKEYNSRWFVFGCAICEDGETYENKTCALDRIVDNIIIKEEVEYIPPLIDYSCYFDEIVGVTHLKNSKKEHIVIQTNDLYTHNRILTKPLHKSQKEVQKFNSRTKLGKVCIDIKPNNELLGLLFSFESHIKILEPESYVCEFNKEVRKQYNLYNK